MSKAAHTAAHLVPQSYGIAMAQCVYGGPRGVWLECQSCDRSDRIAGVKSDISDAAAATVFRRFGWGGEGDRMLRARCPDCAKSAIAAAKGGAA